MKQLLPPPPLFRLALLLGLLLMRSPLGAWAQSASPYQVPLGQAAAYGLLSGGSIVAQDAAGNALPIQALGKAGASGSIGTLVAATAGVFAQGSGTVPAALSSLATARSYCTGQSSTALNADLSGRTLGGGSYTVAGNANLGSNSVLTLTGDTGTVVILNITGTLAVGSQARVKLVGVLPRHVYWNLGGSLSVADQAGFWGVALLPAGTTATLSGYQLGGCALLSAGNIGLYRLSATVGNNQFYAPARTTAICSDPNIPSYPAPSCSFIRPGSELIMDGSFEQRRCCADRGSGITYYLNSSLACFWQSPTGSGSPEYYNACVSSPSYFNNQTGYGIPTNGFTAAAGTYYPVPALAQNSRATTGEGYAGIYAGIPGYPGYREYVYQEIPGGLIAGQRYYAEFSAHLAPSSSHVVTALGMLVAPASLPYPDISSGTIIPYAPTVSGSPRYVNPANPNAPQNDAANLGWQRIGGVFVADNNQATTSSLKIIVGNFGPDTQTLTGGPGGNQAYYFLDNVTLSPLTEAGPSVVVGTCDGTGPTSTTLGTTPMPTLVGATYAWSSSDGSFSSTQPNPVVLPAVTTTYFLTVSIPGQPPYTSQATVTVLGSYAQNPGATYVSTTGAPYDIGASGAVTYIDAGAYGGTVVFDGQYHVQGTVHLVNGTFELAPGTVFFVNGNSGLPVGSGPDTYYTTIVVQEEATLHLEGAALQANCSKERWGGVWLYGRGIARTEQAASGLRSRIEDAITGINSRLDNEYYLNNTDFQHNDIGLYELSANKTAQPLEGARDCTFQNGNYGIVLEGSDYANGIVVGGDYQQASFKYNTFADLSRVGLYVTAGKGYFHTNTFRNCGWASMAAWNVPQTGRASFTGNDMVVPASSTAPSQYGPDVFGATGIFAADPTVLLTNNTIMGAPAPLSTTGVQRTGIHYPFGMGSGGLDQVADNTISNLDQGLSAITNDYTGSAITVKKNTFTNNAAGVVFYPVGVGNGAPVTATIRCNSFINDVNSMVSQPIGIWLKSGAIITSGLGGSNMPGNGNEFLSTQWGSNYPLLNSNTSTASSLIYTRFSTVNESVTLTGPGQVITNTSTSPIGACYGTSPGVNSRQYTTTAPVVTVNNTLDSLRAGNLSTAQQAHLLTSLRSQFLQAAQVSTVEELLTATRLSSASRLAVGLHLLEYYRQQHDQANVARLRTWLGQQNVTDKGELAAYLGLTKVLDRMVSFLPGVRPLAKNDQEQLREVANSGTTSARPACQLLRAYEPTCSCVLLPNDQAPNNSKVPKTTADIIAFETPRPQLAAYPNPATAVLHVPYALPMGTMDGELRAYDIQGRLVLRQVVAGSQGELEVATTAWPAGLYQLRLVAGGRIVGQQRIAITSK